MKVKAMIFAAALAVAQPALSWGEREQGIVTGIAGTLLLQQLGQGRVYVEPSQIYYNHSPRYYQEPRYYREPRYHHYHDYGQWRPSYDRYGHYQGHRIDD